MLESDGKPVISEVDVFVPGTCNNRRIKKVKPVKNINNKKFILERGFILCFTRVSIKSRFSNANEIIIKLTGFRNVFNSIWKI